MGDATKIGISSMNAAPEPITKTCSDEEIPVRHRRLTRCFIPSNIAHGKPVPDAKKAAARKHLAFRASIYLKMCENPLTDDEIQTRDQELLHHIPLMARKLVSDFLSQKMSAPRIVATAKICKVLASEASIIAFAPLRIHSILRCLLMPFSESFLSDHISILKGSAPELAELVTCSVVRDNSQYRLFHSTNRFLMYILQFVHDTHSSDVTPAEKAELPSTYNPLKTGHAYYFRADGKRIRFARDLHGEIRRKSKSDYDDRPNTGVCSKMYPMLGKGSTFMFCWICPSHGHCYGFQMISGSEGRKDPCYSLYCYKEKAPENIFYDFACGLEEYCLNREAGYFHDSMFYHDLFHGYKHKCSTVYHSGRINGLHSINTSICEQFNAYMQCIKATAKHMSQVHFMFFTQFFIHRWNVKKRLRFSTLLNAAKNFTI